jgi:uncharacterized membrane protein
MLSETTLSKRDHARLVGDGFLITAGTASVAMALLFAVMAIPGMQDSVGGAIVGNGILLLGGGVGGVVATWLLHGRRINAPTVIGGVIGPAFGAMTIPLFVGLSFLVGVPLKLVTPSEYAGPLAMLAIVAVALLALIGWLLADAFRDMAPSKRAHYRLDIARIAAAGAFVVLGVACVVLIFASPGPEQGEAVIWAMAGGAIGAGSIAGADLANVLWARQKQGSGTAVAGA